MVASPTPSVIAIDHESMSIDWSSVSGATSYELWRSTSSSGTYSRVYNGSTRSYTDSGLDSNTRYYYKVKSCNTDGCGEFGAYDYDYTDEAPTSPDLIISEFELNGYANIKEV